MLDDQIDATFRFHTGFVKHTLVTGVEGVRETSDPTRNTITGVPTTSLLNPNESQPYSGTSTPSTQVQVTAITLRRLRPRHHSAGQQVRSDRRRRAGIASAPNTINPLRRLRRSAASDRLPSWRGALVYKPKPNGSIYFDAGNSFNPSAETLSLSAANANTPPEKSLTYRESAPSGIWPPASSRSTARCSAPIKPTLANPIPNNPLQNVLGGNQRVDGIQIDGHGSSHRPLGTSFQLCAAGQQGRQLACTIRSPSERRSRTCPETRSISGPPIVSRGRNWKSAPAAISSTSAPPAPRFPTIRPPACSKKFPAIGFSTPWPNIR